MDSTVHSTKLQTGCTVNIFILIINLKYDWGQNKTQLNCVATSKTKKLIYKHCTNASSYKSKKYTLKQCCKNITVNKNINIQYWHHIKILFYNLQIGSPITYLKYKILTINITYTCLMKSKWIYTNVNLYQSLFLLYCSSGSTNIQTGRHTSCHIFRGTTPCSSVHCNILVAETFSVLSTFSAGIPSAKSRNRVQ